MLIHSGANTIQCTMNWKFVCNIQSIIVHMYVCMHARCVFFSFSPLLNLAMHLLSPFTHHNIHKLFPLLVFKNQTSHKRVNIGSIIFIINKCNALGELPNLAKIPLPPFSSLPSYLCFSKIWWLFTKTYIHHYRLQRGRLLSYFNMYLTWTSV